MTAIQTHRAKLSQVRLNYAEAGPPDAPVLFLLHGWPQTWREWSMVIPALSEHYRVIAPDLRGLGDSSRPETGYDTRSVAADIIELADHLGIDRFRLAGHDLGGMTAYALAAHWRNRVEKLVILDVVLPGFTVDKVVRHGADGWGIWHFAFHASPVAEFLVLGREAEYFSWFFRNMAYRPDAIPQDHVATYVRAYQQPGALRPGFAYYRAFYESGLQNQTTAAEKLTIPVLAIGGSASVATMVGDEMKQVATDVTSAVAPESGHWIPEEQPAWLTARLLEFLSD
jgi:pimeloyl-ACP methyl ester carboxylesterase